MMAAMKIEPRQMTLKELLAGYVGIECLPDIPLTGLSMDSREIRSGDLFVALAGNKDHGLAYAESAVAKGAVAVLCDRKFDQYCQEILSALMTRVICVPVANLKERLGEIAGRFYNHPSQRLFTVGVTGTDGKTSVSHFIASALNDEQSPAAVIGTIGNGLVGKLQQASHTTPDVIQVHRMMAEFEQQGVRRLAMEVSSHGLDQGRVDAVDFDVAVLTNFGRDHLDYHGDVDEYRRAKQRLFKRPELKAIVLNLDDEFGCRLAADLQTGAVVWGYTVGSGNDCGVDRIVRATSVERLADGLRMHVVCEANEADVELPLLGEFNVSNALATLAVLLIQGIGFEQALQRLKKLSTVAGRMQAVHIEGRPLVVVDYAHTPQALASALSSLRGHCAGRLFCVFGCGGDRDRGKRPLMAAVAEKQADVVIVTDDNPRTEEAEAIFDDIRKGFDNVGNIQFEHDRRIAIYDAVYQARADDIVLVAGKGHEDYQIVGYEKLSFSDAEVVRQCLEDDE